jgi:hypothetical protein
MTGDVDGNSRMKVAITFFTGIGLDYICLWEKAVCLRWFGEALNISLQPM